MAVIFTFGRGADELLLENRESPEGPLLLITADGRTRSCRFPDVPSLRAFQNDMETFLLRTGWSLLAFSPDRRSYRDRRTFPRVKNDRRRWWTDASPAGDTAPRRDAR